MALRSTLRPVWTLVRSPRTFFEEWPPRRSFGYAFGVVVAVGVLLVVLP